MITVSRVADEEHEHRLTNDSGRVAFFIIILRLLSNNVRFAIRLLINSLAPEKLSFRNIETFKSRT